MSVFGVNVTSHLERNCFFGGGVDIARYDRVKYPQFEKLTDKQLSFFWRPEEIELIRDSKDFRGLNDPEQHILTKVISRATMLDSIQGRGPSLAFLPICSLPELETCISTWAFFENIHSRSYTYLLKNIFPDPSLVLDEITKSQEIVDCADSISKYYDDLISINCLSVVNNQDHYFYEHKKSLWLALNAINALEGIRFYAAFACVWNFAEQKKMEGTAKIFKFIARDENVHLAITQQILKILPKEDPDFAKIQIETRDEVIAMWYDVINEEKQWATFTFQYGSMIGLNERLLHDYIDYIGAKRMGALGLNGKPGSNPLPWTQKWIAGGDVQPAPQEVEISSYLVGAVKQDVDDETFKGFTL